MKKKKTLIIITIAAAIIILAGLIVVWSIPIEKEKIEIFSKEGLHWVFSKLSVVKEKTEIPQEIITELAKSGPVVKITSQSFNPQEVILSQGQSINFVNEDNQTHKVLSENYRGTGPMEPISVGILTFNNKGTIEFYLENYPDIKLKVIVK